MSGHMEHATVRIAVIGIGVIGPRHVQSILACGEASLAALVGPGEGACTLAERYGVLSYRSVDEMLSSSTAIDAAVVCTPNSTHVAISKALLGAGIHVLVEKPVSLDIESGLDLVATATRSRSRLLVGHHRRFNVQVTAAKRVIDGGAIGKPIALSGLWMLHKPASYFEGLGAWRAASEGGVIFINMVHEIDTLQYMLGLIVRVHAEQTISQRRHEAEEGAAIILRFASGVVGTFLVSDAAPSPHSFEAGTGENPIIPKSSKDYCRIFGSEGVLSMGDMTVHKHRAADDVSWSNALEEESLSSEDCVPFDEQIAHFVRVVRDEELPRCNASDGVRAVQVVEAVKQAMRSGKAVAIETARSKL